MLSLMSDKVDFWERLEADDTGLPHFFATDPLGREVEINRETWESHIKSGHEEVMEFRDLAFQAIRAPVEMIEGKPTEKNQPVWIYHTEIPPERLRKRGEFYLRVVVKYVRVPEKEHRTIGFIRTMHMVRRKWE